MATSTPAAFAASAPPHSDKRAARGLAAPRRMRAAAAAAATVFAMEARAVPASKPPPQRARRTPAEAPAAGQRGPFAMALAKASRMGPSDRSLRTPASAVAMAAIAATALGGSEGDRKQRVRPSREDFVAAVENGDRFRL